MDYNWFYYDGIPLQYRYNHTVNVVKDLLEDDKTVYIIKSPYEEQIPEVKEMFVVLDNNFILEKMPETYFNRMDVVFYKIKLKRNNMKIAVIMPGYHQIPYEFCRYLAKDGYKVTFILPERNEEMSIMGDGFRIIHLKTLPNLIDLPITPSLYFYLKKENFDIIVSSEDFQPMSFIAAFYASKFNKPFFPIIEKYFLSRFFFLRQLHKFQLKFIAPLYGIHRQGLYHIALQQRSF